LTFSVYDQQLKQTTRVHVA